MLMASPVQFRGPFRPVPRNASQACPVAGRWCPSGTSKTTGSPLGKSPASSKSGVTAKLTESTLCTPTTSPQSDMPVDFCGVPVVLGTPEPHTRLANRHLKADAQKMRCAQQSSVGSVVFGDGDGEEVVERQRDNSAAGGAGETAHLQGRRGMRHFHENLTSQSSMGEVLNGKTDPNYETHADHFGEEYGRSRWTGSPRRDCDGSPRNVASKRMDRNMRKRNFHGLSYATSEAGGVIHYQGAEASRQNMVHPTDMGLGLRGAAGKPSPNAFLRESRSVPAIRVLQEHPNQKSQVFAPPSDAPHRAHRRQADRSPSHGMVRRSTMMDRVMAGSGRWELKNHMWYFQEN